MLLAMTSGAGSVVFGRVNTRFALMGGIDRIVRFWAGMGKYT